MLNKRVKDLQYQEEQIKLQNIADICIRPY